LEVLQLKFSLVSKVSSPPQPLKQQLLQVVLNQVCLAQLKLNLLQARSLVPNPSQPQALFNPLFNRVAVFLVRPQLHPASSVPPLLNQLYKDVSHHNNNNQLLNLFNFNRHLSSTV